MRFLIFLIILAGAGYGAWKYGLIGGGADEAAPPALDPDQTVPLPNPGPGPEVRPSSNPNGLPSDLEQQLAATEARWQTIVDAGDDPLVHAQTVDLNRAFGAILKATYNKPALADLQQRLVETYLQPSGAKLFLSKTRYPEDASGLLGQHVVVANENLNIIGRKYGMSSHFLNITRGRVDKEDGSIHPGDRLKVVKVNETSGFLLHVDKSDYRLDVWIGDNFVRRYPVGIGAVESPTPVGESFLDAREQQPTWYHPKTNLPIPFGHPDHVIGAFWLRINDGELGQKGIGFHGYTGQGPAVGAQVSNGCLRMQNEDVAELFWLLPPMLIKPSGEYVSRAPKTQVVITK